MISVVMPCYNESEVLNHTYRTLVAAAQEWDVPFELILVDDGSRDYTPQIIEQIAAADERVRGVFLSRNFGHQAALGAGLEYAAGDAVVVMDADLQDPPELVESMIQEWRAGYDVVYAKRRRRQGVPATKKLAGFFFYRVLERITDVPIPRDTGDFALLDARVVKQLRAFSEQRPFWRGLRCWSGFRQTAVEFERPPRAGGEPKYTWRKLVHLAASGILSFSNAPLRLPLYLGLGALAATACTTLVAATLWIVRGATAWPVSGLALLVVAALGVQLVSVGILGEYLARIYDEVRARPRWVVERTVGKVGSQARVQQAA